MHRAGLALVLGDLPTYVGAYHVLGSNFIVLNKTILDFISLKARSRVELNSFIFYLLLHEYLHSLGFTSEKEVRSLVYQLSVENFGREHPTAKLAAGGFAELYPELRHIPLRESEPTYELIKDFDKSSTPYIM